MKQYLTATIQAATPEEIEGIIDPLRLAQIKATDPTPELRVYSVGHEGQANLHLPGIGNKTFTWIQAAVQWVADKLHLGTAVFDRHNPNSNSHEGRIKIGEVVGKTVRQIGNRLNTLAAIYIFPQFKARPLDVASIEAEILYDHDDLQAWPTAIKNVSGIALGNSGIDTPGFPGATLLGAVQAYVQAFGSEIGENKMNKSDVRRAVEELGLTPTQVFGVDDIMSDSKVVEKVNEAKKNVIAGSERIQRERDEAKERIVVLENEKADSDKRLQQIQMQSKSNPLLTGIIADRKLNANAGKFVMRNLKNFTATATDEAGLKEELGKFVDTTYAEYQELAKDVFEVDTSSNMDKPFVLPKEFLVDSGGQTGQSPQQSGQRPVTRDERIADEMNPETNPLIPGGKAARSAQ